MVVSCHWVFGVLGLAKETILLNGNSFEKGFMNSQSNIICHGQSKECLCEYVAEQCYKNKFDYTSFTKDSKASYMGLTVHILGKIDCVLTWVGSMMQQLSGITCFISPLLRQIIQLYIITSLQQASLVSIQSRAAKLTISPGLCQPKFTSQGQGLPASHSAINLSKCFLYYQPFVWGIHWSPDDSSHKEQLYRTLMFPLLSVCTYSPGAVEDTPQDNQVISV